MIPGYEDFEFDLPGALLKNLVVILDGITKIPLTGAAASAVPEEQGVYQLFLDDEPVYVGKTDSEAGLQKRLTRHSRKIQQRQALDPARVQFKAVRIYVFTAMDVESDLIRHYGGVTGLAWNGSGFGSNDPGRNRDSTKNKPTNFDALFPIDIDRPFDTALPAAPARVFLQALNTRLPYTLRSERHADLNLAAIPSLAAPFTTRGAIAHVVAHLPPGWQATKLLGYVILYHETRAYPDSEVIARS